MSIQVEQGSVSDYWTFLALQLLSQFDVIEAEELFQGHLDLKDKVYSNQEMLNFFEDM